MFLTGALAVQLTEELRFGALGLGTAVSLQRLASIPMVGYAGRLVDRLGAARSLRLGALIAAVSCLGVAFVARDWVTLAIWLALSGAAMALADPGANRMLVNSVPSGRLGTAFGFKQSAPPIATMLAGLAVPLIALTVGWRWAFALGGLACIVVTVSVGAPPSRVRRTSRTAAKERLRDRGLIVLLAIGLGFGTASSAVVPAFYVAGAVAAGASPTLAGTLLAVASVATILTRMGAGWLADRMPRRPIQLFMVGQLVGFVGHALLSTGTPGIMAVGVVLALAGTWGFHGVFWFAMVRAYRDTPGAITGAVSPGALTGGALSPLVFGAVATAHGYRAAWALAAALSLVAVLISAIGSRRLFVREVPGDDRG